MIRTAKHLMLGTGALFIYHRAESKAVTFLVSIFMLYAMSNYVLAQFMAMGHILGGISGGRIPYAAGVIFFAIIMFIFIHFGGFRGVAWTDTIQGITMLFGLLLIIGMVFSKAGSLSEITMKIAQIKPKLVGAPPGKVIVTWYSVLILVGIGAAIYPQAIQRIYAARDLRTLKRSLALMAFMPYMTALVIFFVGIICIPMFADLGKIRSDDVFPMLLSKIMGKSTLGYALVVIVLSAVGVAIMSTADSVVLTLASIYAVDVHKKFTNPNLAQEELARVGKIANAIILAILTYIAITPRLTLWRLTEIKFEYLIQVAPAILLGVRAKRLNNAGLFLGMLVGGIMAAGMMLSGHKQVSQHTCWIMGLTG
ncbi:MAG: sodium:solute symporter family protein [Synergistetes bacterium]|nr:sodium:solute symporter family protein [Synergistota bacterium]